MPATTESNQNFSSTMGNMQKHGMSTTDIIKALAAPLLKDLNLPKDAKGAAPTIIASDVIIAQTNSSVKHNIETSDVIMDKIGDMRELIENIIDKKPKMIAPEFIENFNSLVAKTNINSSDLWKLLEEVKKSVQDKNVMQSELLSLSQNGKISGVELVHKLREQKEKIKQRNMTDTNSIKNQSSLLTTSQANTEKPLAKNKSEIITLLNLNRMTIDSVRGTKPAAAQQPMQQTAPEAETTTHKTKR